MTMLSRKLKIYFCSSNKNKLKEIKEILPLELFDVRHYEIELKEIQGDVSEISRTKCRQAYEEIKQNVLVEDTALSFNALNQLPGPYVKCFLSRIGPDGLCKMLDAYDDKSASAICVFSYWDGTTEQPKTFEGFCHGKIVTPRGKRDFGWDCIFQPDGFNETFAEMNKETKNKISHRYAAAKLFTEYIANKVNEETI